MTADEIQAARQLLYVASALVTLGVVLGLTLMALSAFYAMQDWRYRRALNRPDTVVEPMTREQLQRAADRARQLEADGVEPTFTFGNRWH